MEAEFRFGRYFVSMRSPNIHSQSPTTWKSICRKASSNSHLTQEQDFLFILLAGFFTTLAAVPVFAAVESEQTINWGVMGMKLFGGLALFLFGMEQMADALKAVAGERMKRSWPS